MLAVVCLSFSVGETFAQERDFANSARFAKENAALPKPSKKEKRVVFMGNSITEGWIRTHPDFFKSNGYISRVSVGRLLVSFCCVFGKM